MSLSTQVRATTLLDVMGGKGRKGHGHKREGCTTAVGGAAVLSVITLRPHCVGRLERKRIVQICTMGPAVRSAACRVLTSSMAIVIGADAARHRRDETGDFLDPVKVDVATQPHRCGSCPHPVPQRRA